MPKPRRRSSSRSSTCAWIVTSSAVVGSSAISSLGRRRSRSRSSRAGACRRTAGADSRRRGDAASGMLHADRAARSRGRARPARQTFSCSRSTSDDLPPTVSTGLSEVIGSWKIMRDLACRAPRASPSRQRRAGRAPSKQMRPEAIFALSAAAGASARTPSATCRSPNSPTIARSRRARTAKLQSRAPASWSGKRDRQVVGHRAGLSASSALGRDRGLRASFSPSPIG